MGGLSSRSAFWVGGEVVQGSGGTGPLPSPPSSCANELRLRLAFLAYVHATALLPGESRRERAFTVK